jgi:hypothetical protein
MSSGKFQHIQTVKSVSTFRRTEFSAQLLIQVSLFDCFRKQYLTRIGKKILGLGHES